MQRVFSSVFRHFQRCSYRCLTCLAVGLVFPIVDGVNYIRKSPYVQSTIFRVLLIRVVRTEEKQRQKVCCEVC